METKSENEARYMTQEEVARRFGISTSTVKNWRDKGLFEYFQAPGSRRVLYPREAIEAFESQHRQKSNVVEFRRPVEISGTKPEVSSKSEKKIWRI